MASAGGGASMATEKDIRQLARRVVEEILGAESGPAASGDIRRTVAMGADHRGVELKTKLAERLREKGYEVTDCGTFGPASVDYPDIAHAVAELVAAGRCECGIILDGAGIGSCMAANKVPGVRAALCWDISSARNSREHNHANVLTLGAGLIGESLAEQIVETWLETPWGGERFARRVEKLMEIEQRYLAQPTDESR